MAEFQAHAELSVSVDQRSLSTARQQIENDLGDVEVGMAPTGDGGGAVGSRGPEPATVDIARRQLGEQETLAELAQERNELLDDLRAGGGGGGGGGGGAGSTILQTQGALSFLGGGVGGAAAGAAGGLSALLPILGITGGAALGAGFLTQQLTGAEATGGQSPATRQVELTNIPTDFPSINVEAPGWLQGVAQGLGIDINVNTDSTVTVVDESLQRSEQQRFGQAQDQLSREQAREAESIARSEVQRFEQRLERKLGQTSSRSGGGAFAAKGNPFEG